MRDAPPRVWLEYRLELLKFAGGGLLDFSRRRSTQLPVLRFNDDDPVVAIENLGIPVAELDKLIQNLTDVEIREIDYRVASEGYAAAHYYHPGMKGHHVFLLPRMSGDKTLRIRQQFGKRFFSRRYTLAEITHDKVPSEQRVWQFLDNV